ncbi:Pentatricopeptide repeat-containing protein [Colletotrichum trifolii]|uniref:Pentatricopeptide repeat-containing protein n=1 Tax=Colletotrichum trifolii TaxID=5466 RepID=A0A4R8RMG6_COLTR|nr:Pentatricopeptide repeat-containing protein [Colletotrichum trifolii]
MRWQKRKKAYRRVNPERWLKLQLKLVQERSTITVAGRKPRSLPANRPIHLIARRHAGLEVSMRALPLEASRQRSRCWWRPTEFDRELAISRHCRTLEDDTDNAAYPTPWDESARRRALDLFESTVNNQAPQATGPAPDVNQHIRLVEQLNAIRNNSEKLPAVDMQSLVHKFIVAKLLPAVRQQGRQFREMPHVVKQTAAVAIRKLTEAKLANIDDPKLPTVTEICKVLAEIDHKKAPRRLELVHGLLIGIIASRSGATDTPEHNGGSTDEVMLRDLIEFWKHFSGLNRADSGLGSTSKFWLTSRLDMRATTNPATLFAALFPNYQANALTGLQPALVATFVLLSEPLSEQLRAEAAPLLEALEPVVKRFGREKLQSLFEGYDDLWAFVEPRAGWRVIQAAPEVLREPHNYQAMKEPPRNQAYGSHGTSVHFSYASWHKRFNIAYRGNDHAAVQQAWRDLINPVNDKDRAERLRNCPELFDYILHMSCHKSRYEQQLYADMIREVLTYMRKLRLEPTVRTYTSMMEGWKLAGRFESIQHLWNTINGAKVKLDKKIWSSWISANGSLGAHWAGIKALNDMDKIWNKAVEANAEHTAVKPCIASVNAAISGLLRRDRMNDVRQVLVWANEKDLNPDIYTYNMLLSRMLKTGAREEADEILNSMKTAGIAPDGATFTIILESAFEDMAERTPHEQKAVIDNVFREMSACGIEPNQETYAKMLHSLMLAGDVAQASVTAVLSHLRANGLQPSTEICTILVEYYISRSKPDLDSIRALVADRRSRTRALTDRAFWETVIMHLHRAGDLDGALEIFYDLDDWGIWPSLPLLEPLLRSLIHRQQWDAAEKLVDTVKRQPRPQAAERDSRYWKPRPQATERDSRYWKHAFWAVANDYGLLKPE